MSLDKQLLRQQYAQCNEHLIEISRERDVLLGFYITISLAFYGFFEKISTDAMVAGVALLELTFLGICLGFLFTLFRGWRSTYVICAIILQEMIHKNKTEIDEEVVKKIDYRFNSLTSGELLIFLLLNVVVLVNSAAGYYFAKDISWRIFSVVMIGVAVLEFVSHFVFMAYLDHLKNSGGLEPDIYGFCGAQ